MRFLAPIIGFCAGLCGIASACAADLPPVQAERNVGLHYSGRGHRSSPIVIYDYQPGVVVRAYWLAPWRHRHYYPVTGQQPIAGRDEDLSARAEATDPAEAFSRTWTTSSAFVVEDPRGRFRDFDGRQPPPPTEPPLK
ncbi:MAG TPA: hypothetical protein VN655_17050 [Pseudolabrys sp.]|nr:hypothetical protein [Pseudolabrys sp.]